MNQNVCVSDNIWDALCDLVQFVQLKKTWKKTMEEWYFSQVEDLSLQLYQKYHSSIGVFHVF